jgi:FAD/FMN-containing dehydrogenase
MTTYTLDVRDASGLRAAVDSPVILPTDPEYERYRRVWNADIDRHPAAIVLSRTTAHVQGALRWALEHDFEVTVRGGGHNIAGTAVLDDAIVIDSGQMNAIGFDHDRGTIKIGGGTRLGELDRACADHDVVVPSGTVSDTGVAGLLLGGGMGWLSRMYGLTIDQLIEVEMVVADGTVLRANDREHSDLFWAVRGAGHNYGIVTEFTFRYIPFTRLANVRQAIYPAHERTRVLQFYRDWAYDAPDHVVTFARTVNVPPYWSQVPTEYRGQPVVSITSVHWGDAEEEASETTAMFNAGKAVWEAAYTTRYVDLQHACDDDFRNGLRHHWRNLMMTGLPDDAIETVLDFSDRYPGRPLQASATIAPQFDCPVQINPRGGQIARVDHWATAVGDRVDARWLGTVSAQWEYGYEGPQLVEWVRAFDGALARYKQGAYVNFASVVGDEAFARMVYGDKYDRLVQVKKAYDPTNVFRRGLADLSGRSSHGTG